MKRSVLCLSLLLASLGCVREHVCREGTVFVTIKFHDSWQLVDGVAMKYQLDNGPVVDIAPPISRPVNSDEGILELDIKDYSKHSMITLQYAPTKDGVVVGAWESVTADLTAACVAGTLTVKVSPQDASTGAPGDGPAPADAREASPAPDAAAGEPVPDVLPDLEPNLGPDLGPDLGPGLGPDLGPDLGTDLGPDLGPDVSLGLDGRDTPAVIDVPTGSDSALDRAQRSRDLGQDLGPDLGPDLLPDLGPDLAPARLTATPGSLAFGTVPLGSQSGLLSFTITNVGQQPSGQIALAWDTSEFVQQSGSRGDCLYDVYNLAPGASCTVRIAFVPAANGNRAGSVTYSAIHVAKNCKGSGSGRPVDRAAAGIPEPTVFGELGSVGTSAISVRAGKATSSKRCSHNLLPQGTTTKRTTCERVMGTKSISSSILGASAGPSRSSSAARRPRPRWLAWSRLRSWPVPAALPSSAASTSAVNPSGSSSRTFPTCSRRSWPPDRPHRRLRRA